VRDEDALYDIVDVLVEIGEAHDVSAAQIALARTLGRPGVASLVIGAHPRRSSRPLRPSEIGPGRLVAARAGCDRHETPGT
jgi:hypothetical protein